MSPCVPTTMMQMERREGRGRASWGVIVRPSISISAALAILGSGGPLVLEALPAGERASANAAAVNWTALTVVWVALPAVEAAVLAVLLMTAAWAVLLLLAADSAFAFASSAAAPATIIALLIDGLIDCNI